MTLVLRRDQLTQLSVMRAIADAPSQVEVSYETQSLSLSEVGERAGCIQWDDSGFRVTTPAGRSFHVGLARLGAVNSLTDAAGHRCDLRFDRQGRLCGLTLGERTIESTFRDDGQLAASRLPSGETLEIHYDQEGRRTAIAQGEGPPTARFAYDEQGELASYQDGVGNMTRFESDALGRLEQLTFADGSSWQLAYDGDGHLQQLAIDGFACHTISRDADRTTVEYGDGSWVQYEVGEASSEVLTPQHYLCQLHDREGRLHAEHVDGVEVVRYLKDGDDPVGLAVAGAAPIGWRCDRDGALEQVRDWSGQAIDVSYETWGPLSRITYPNGVVTHFVSDDLGQPLSITTQGATGAELLTRQYRYDTSGREVEELCPASRRRFEYDQRGRLATVRESDAAQRATHRKIALQPDVMGNPTRLAGHQAHYNALLQLASLGPERFSYDARGHLKEWDTPGRGWRYRVDAGGQLEEVWCNGQRIARYSYDGLGRRQTKTTREGLTRYTWASGQLVREVTDFDDGGSRQTDYLYLPGGFLPLAMRQDGAIYYLHCDRRGTPVIATDAAGEVVWQGASDVFGAMTTRGTIYQPLRLPGQQFDAETGLHYNLARYYDPRLGRYLSRDPLWVAGGSLNFYIYGDGDPLNHCDPLGLFIFIGAMVATALVSAVVGGAYKGYQEYQRVGGFDTPEQKGAVLEQTRKGWVAGGLGGAAAGVVMPVAATATTVAGATQVVAAAGGIGALVERCSSDMMEDGQPPSPVETLETAAGGMLLGGVFGKFMPRTNPAQSPLKPGKPGGRHVEELTTSGVPLKPQAQHTGPPSSMTPNFTLKSPLDPAVQRNWVKRDPSMEGLLKKANEVVAFDPSRRRGVEQTLSAATNDGQLRNFLKNTVDHSNSVTRADRALMNLRPKTHQQDPDFPLHDFVGPGNKLDLDVARRLSGSGRDIYTRRGIEAHRAATAHHNPPSSSNPAAALKAQGNDIIDALRQPRSYKPGMSFKEIEDIIPTFKDPKLQGQLQQSLKDRKLLEMMGIVGYK